MKILILSPLFPPDVGEPASYVKELMRRLEGHSVEALIYGYLPESVPTVQITAVDKRSWVLKRLFTYTRSLFKAQASAEIIILNNAPSIELPLLFVSLFYKRRIILCESDPRASKAAQSGFYKTLHTQVKKRCVKVITLPDQSVYNAPETLPFSEPNPTLLQARASWWSVHVKELTIIWTIPKPGGVNT